MKRHLPHLGLLVVALLSATLSVALAAPKKGGGGGGAGATRSVSIGDMRFDPASLDVNVGDTVVWTNNDVRDHTVVARDGSFNSGNLNNGESFRFTFKKAGTFAYSCSLHPRMKGQVNVSGS